MTSMRWWWAGLAPVVVLAVGGALGCVTHRGVQAGRAYMFQPAVVRAEEARPVTRTYRVRAYADEVYRTTAADWAERIAAQVRRASAVTEGDFGVRLELAELRPWSRADPAPRLGAALRELTASDPATDVDWVVGFVGGYFEDGTVDAGGMARLFGRHLVARAAEPPGMTEAMAQAWTALREDERAALQRSWREHTETVVLLHEWAHTLGAVHECDAKWLMSPKESLLAGRFSPGSRALVRAGLEHRDAPTPAGWAAAYRTAAAAQEAVAWDCPVLAEGLGKAQAILEGGPAPAGGARR